ncbi:hypothetical protein Glove_22g129 [Diversispora epigaea]|uniref:Uncharacterized protein n=1 Tax=Diversispora epigaea TaxID=1348612 RepID=A0A397JMG9_9GLOM|nr:hypothetical protein Glove_22g129 [Diversispora epigaea]
MENKENTESMENKENMESMENKRSKESNSGKQINKESLEKRKEKELENKPISEEITTEEEEEIPKFTPEEIEKLVNLANNYKLNGNEYFLKSKYEEAIKEYEKALDTCPTEKKDERAIYWGNIGTCYVKLEKLKEAVDAYNKSLEDSPAYTKVLFRRAQANEKLHTLTSLTSALQDYKILQSSSQHQSQLNLIDRKSINSSIQRLPSLISQQQEKEKDEVIGKLKDLGNRFLGSFGLSTDNFKMVQDPNSGGYNVQFVNNSNQGDDRNGSSG